MEYLSTNPAKRQRLDSLKSTSYTHPKLELSNGSGSNLLLQNGHDSTANNDAHKLEFIEISSDDDEELFVVSEKDSSIKPNQNFKLKDNINFDGDDSDDEIIILSEKRVASDTPQPRNGAVATHDNRDHSIKMDPGVKPGGPEPIIQHNNQGNAANNSFHNNQQSTTTNPHRQLQPVSSNSDNHQLHVVRVLVD